jgi:dihydrodipicolinate synthase/N-acetylneuraminate lyase
MPSALACPGRIEMTEIAPRLGGVIPIVAAPFTPSGAFDAESFQRLVRWLIRSGASGLTLFGLATEFYKLTDDERAEMQTLFLAETASHPEVAGIISITDHSWEIAVERARAAAAAGADALMVLPPYFLGPAESAIVEHIRRVAAAVRLPIVVQYAPNQTGVRLAPALFAQLAADLPNLVAVKVEIQPPGRYLTDLLAVTAGRVQALVGYAGVQMPDVLARGAAGVQPGCSFTEIYVALYQSFQRGDRASMRALHQRLLPYISYWMQGVELIIRAEKRILQRRGLIASDYCRHPAATLDADEEAMIDDFLATFGDLLPDVRP